jgi:DNA-binding response OmpR family regulator
MSACLIIDPDDRLHDTLAPSLQRLALSVARSTRAPTVLSGPGVDLVLARVRHADREQLRVCEAARQAWNARVVVFMDRPEPVDQVLALTWGADAVVDPRHISERELEARLRSLLRRRGGPTAHADWALDEAAQRLQHGTLSVPLSRSETQVLQVLMAQAGTVMSRAELMARSKLGQQGSHLNVVDLAVSRLRRKLQDAGVTRIPLLTERGRGYRWATPAPIRQAAND